jgi:hypothetical protein
VLDSNEPTGPQWEITFQHGVLAELDAFFAAFLAANAALTMLGLDALSVWAIVVIVVHVLVLRRIFRRIGMVRRPLSHSQDSFLPRAASGTADSVQT